MKVLNQGLWEEHPQNRLHAFRMRAEMATRMPPGNQIQSISFFKTRKPHLLKNALMPSGETIMGVQGKNTRRLSKGEKSAIPNPPSVKASRIPWLAVTIKKKAK